ncbi:MAG: CDP-alcohol phosphatidyltransferase family protein [Candidatus Omnitrophica bacterium]|nr:CDP-alcohol phosphatidyltransferase family protein [Candidatus Omnitrophota bacterium]
MNLKISRDFRANRLLSKPLTAIFIRTPLTPNHVTALCLASGIAGGFLFSMGRSDLSAAAAFFYCLAVILDNCDGEIARAKNLRSRFGEWFDIAADFLNDNALFIGVAAGLIRTHETGPVLLFLFLALTGTGMHFLILIAEKLKGFGPAVFENPSPAAGGPRNFLLKTFDALREGEASWLVLALALLGKTSAILWLGGIYMQALWLSAAFLNLKWLARKPSDENP